MRCIRLSSGDQREQLYGSAGMTGQALRDDLASLVRDWVGGPIGGSRVVSDRAGAKAFHVTVEAGTFVLKVAERAPVRGQEIRTERKFLLDYFGTGSLRTPLGFLDDGDTQALLLPWQDGQSLSRYVRSVVAEQGTAMQRGLMDVLRTIGAMHARGFAHGDVQPGHIIFNESPTGVRLIDFGVSGPIGSQFAGGLLEFASPQAARRLAAGKALHRSADDDLYGVAVAFLYAARGGSIYAYGQNLEPTPASRESRLAVIAQGSLLEPSPYESANGLLRRVRRSVELWRAEPRVGRLQLIQAAESGAAG